jgi:hypothetical protein
VTTLPVDASIDPQIINGVNRLNDLITSAETLNRNLPFQPIPVAAINAANVSGLSLNANVANALINAPATGSHSTVNPTGVTGTGFTNQRRETSTRLAAINPIERNGIDDVSDPAGRPTNQQVGNPNKDNEPITNLTNLLDLKVPPGTIQGTTVNILGDFRNTGFVFAENINIAATVDNLINERRLANPGTVEFEAGGGNWVFERGDRAQPGGFMSAVNWNINAQHIQSIGGTFEFKGMTDAQTAQFTSFLRAQLQSMYGENFTESDIRDAISQDFHANKKPNQLRMILAVVVAIIVVIVTQDTGAGLATSSSLTSRRYKLKMRKPLLSTRLGKDFELHSLTSWNGRRGAHLYSRLAKHRLTLNNITAARRWTLITGLIPAIPQWFLKPLVFSHRNRLSAETSTTLLF